MAYAAAAVSSVMRSLDYLLHFSSMVLRIQKFQIETFIQKCRVIARLFEELSTSMDQSHCAQLVEIIYSTILEVTGEVEIEDFFDETDLIRVTTLVGIVKKLAIHITRSTPRRTEMILEELEEGQGVLEEMPKTLEEMGVVEVELRNFFPEMLNDKFPYPMSILENMFSVISKFKTDTTFVHKEAVEIIGLFRDLSFFMAFLRDTAKLYKNQDEVKDLEKCISVMASQAEDFIEEKLLDISLRSKLDSFIFIVSKAQDFDRVRASHEAWLDSLRFMESKIAQDFVKETLAEARLTPLTLMASRVEDSVEENRAEDFVEEDALDNVPVKSSESRFLRGTHSSAQFGSSMGRWIPDSNFSISSPELPHLLSPDLSKEEFPQSLLDLSSKFDMNPLLSIIKALDDTFHKENGILPTLLSKFKEIESLKEKVKTMYDDETPEIEPLRSSSISTKLSKTPPLFKVDMVVGLDDISNEILHRRTIGLEILTIVGMGGIGKTTLARKIYDDPFAVYHFHCRAWVAVSQDYQVKDLLVDLLRSIMHLGDVLDKMSKEELAEYLYKRLKGRRYLIVMDDIWSINVWDDVNRIFPDDRNGSRILLTSRLKSVVPNSPPHCMSFLGVDESWKLLELKVFGKGSCPPELVDCGRQIAKKCRGLPLAIVVISGYLSQIERTYQCWKDTVARLSSLAITEPEQCLDILALSYYHLPHQLKACFLYMAAFPEDCEISVQKLINLWIAEGFLDSNSSKSLEEVGEDCFNDLVDRGLVMVGKRSLFGKIKTCRIHDLLRELCLRESQKEKFMEVIKRDSHGFPADLNDKHLLSFHSEFDVGVYLLRALPLVRSFLCFSSGCFFSPDIFFLHLRFKLLKVLDICFLRFDRFPKQILKLVLLRYLELNVSYMFPPQFSLLRNLEILVIHWNIKQDGGSPYLQLAAPRLRSLHIIRIGNSCTPILPGTFWPFIRFTQAAPKFLQTLSTVRFASCTREVFQILPRLKKLGICETEEDYNAREPSNFLANLVYLEELEILKCYFYAEKDIKPYKLLNGAFPASIKQLTLSWSYLPWEDMSTISWLPNLEVLKLKNYAFQGPEWTPTEDGFLQLKHLLIEKTDLECWNASSNHFPKLTSLVLRLCASLDGIPFSVGEIATLELIQMHYCSVSLEASAKEIGSQIEGVEVRIQSNPSAG